MLPLLRWSSARMIAAAASLRAVVSANLSAFATDFALTSFGGLN
jgi:hypothetical protein